MSIRIALETAPEFYTNLDTVRGRVIMDLSRVEQVGSIVVKLEGESKTCLGVMADGRPVPPHFAQHGGTVSHEDHKILYRVLQVFPDERAQPAPTPPFLLAPGHHEFPFGFKMPFNNACSDPAAMARIGGLAGPGGFGGVGGGGIRVMDGTRQLMYSHVTKTLPPSFTGYPGMAEVRYYIKVTVQRPGIFRENWRYQVGLKFLPLEPPRPEPSGREAYARRPYAFQPPKGVASPSLAPTIEMSARLPHPSILTCNQPIPLRLMGKKLNACPGQVFLSALQIDLVGLTHVRTQGHVYTEPSRWVVLSARNLVVPVCTPDDPEGAEVVLPDDLWRCTPLPNSVMPSFVACNVSREYRLEIRLGLSWATGHNINNKMNLFRGKAKAPHGVWEMHLPLHFSSVDVYSGVAPPPELLRLMGTSSSIRLPGKTRVPGRTNHGRPPGSVVSVSVGPPPLPARPIAPQQQTMTSSTTTTTATVTATYDPLYPPPLLPGQLADEDAPPSYNEAMAEQMTGPVLPEGRRPAYSGQTNENAPSAMPGKA